MDREAFRKRFKRWKNGEKVYDNGNKIPFEDDQYDYKRAYELGYQRDETGHLPSRDYKTGRYLKKATHPTIMKSIVSDLGEGYIPWYNKKDGLIYSHRWPDDVPDHYKNGKLPGYKNGKEDEDEFGINIGKVIGTTISQNAEKIKRANNIKTDSKISEQTNYGWKNVMRTPFHTDSLAKVQINPAWRIGAYGAALIAKITGKADMSDATKDDISFWNRHLGYPRDYESMPVTGIRFSGDYNKDGSARLPLAEYSGLSKIAKNFIRDGIKSGDIKVNKDGSWLVVDEARGRYGKYTSHLGSYSIRENNGSGIYDVYDTYDFPWYSGVFNRDEGKLIEIRDSIWGNNAKPQYYDPLFSANLLKLYKDGKIAIKPANRGKFNATKKRTGKTTEELTHSKNPITRKRAIFALNAKKWKH